jgi:hypothetical protein
MAYSQISPLGGSRDETWCGQGIRECSVSCSLPKLSRLWRCNGGFGPCGTQNHRNLERLSLCWHAAAPPPPPAPSWPSWLLYRRGWKSQRDLRITLYILYFCETDWREVSNLSSSQNLLSVSRWKKVYLYYQNLTLLIRFEGAVLKDRNPVFWLKSTWQAW